MEICDNCGRMIPRKIRNWEGCGNVDDGYFCSDKCSNEDLKKRGFDEDE